MKITVLLSTFLLASVLANPTGSPEEIEDSTKCQGTDLKLFNVSLLDCTSSKGITVYFKKIKLHGTELIVRGHENDDKCKKTYDPGEGEDTFFVKYGDCGVNPVNNETKFYLNVYRPPGEIRESAQIQLIQCNFSLTEKVVQNTFLLDGLTQRNNSPAIVKLLLEPIYELKIVHLNSTPVDKVEPGKPIIAQLCNKLTSQLAKIKNCYLTSDLKNHTEQFVLIDKDGCPKDPAAQSWNRVPETNCIQLPFKAIKMTHWNEVHVFCEVEPCHPGDNCELPYCEQLDQPCRG